MVKCYATASSQLSAVATTFGKRTVQALVLVLLYISLDITVLERTSGGLFVVLAGKTTGKSIRGLGEDGQNSDHSEPETPTLIDTAASRSHGGPRILTVLTTYNKRSTFVKFYKKAVLGRTDGFRPMVCSQMSCIF